MMLDQTLAALADPTRRGVVDLLRARPHRAGELAAALEVTPAALSRHLRILRRGGLIAEQGIDADARIRLYHLKPAPFAELRDWIEQVQSFWAAELHAFKRHAEGKPRRKRQ